MVSLARAKTPFPARGRAFETSGHNRCSVSRASARFSLPPRSSRESRSKFVVAALGVLAKGGRDFSAARKSGFFAIAPAESVGGKTQSQFRCSARVTTEARARARRREKARGRKEERQTDSEREEGRERELARTRCRRHIKGAPRA